MKVLGRQRGRSPVINWVDPEYGLSDIANRIRVDWDHPTTFIRWGAVCVRIWRAR